MTALTRFLYPTPALRSPRAILAWWERRRLAYNAVVGGAGLVTIAAVSVLSVLPPRTGFRPPPGALLQLVVVYATLANVCYSLGPAIELLLHRLWGEEVQPSGGVLFRQGLIFSVGLTLLPIVLAAAGWVAHLVTWLVG